MILTDPRVINDVKNNPNFHPEAKHFEAFAEGLIAREANGSFHDCPYPERSAEAAQWLWAFTLADHPLAPAFALAITKYILPTTKIDSISDLTRAITGGTI